MEDSARGVMPARGKLGVLLPGMGAVSTTLIAGVELVKKGLGRPIGCLTQYGSLRSGADPGVRRVQDCVPLADLDSLVFGGWDIFPDTCYETALHAGVLEPHRLAPVREELSTLRPWKAVFDQHYVRRLSGPHVKQAPNKYELALQLRTDIADFRTRRGLARLVMLWCGSTEIFLQTDPIHTTLRRFEAGLKNNHPAITPTMIYAYAALMEGVPFGNGAPNLAVEIPALRQLADENGVPVCGKDFKTGQTLLKTILAPGLRARSLGLRGWFSTNILGNRDGEVLDDPASLQTKEHSKLSVLDSILQPEVSPELYADYEHQVHIHYYKARGDEKEGWDNIDIFGWLDYPMQIKLNFLCRDSILAAPVALDLVLLLDLAQRSGLAGVQDWLAFYFKSPICSSCAPPQHDLFAQLATLEDTLVSLGQATASPVVRAP